MTTKSLLSTFIILILVSVTSFATSFRTVTINSTDGLHINVDIYESDQLDAPIILMFHQAGYSRGEYREIAPKLVNMGFTCIAIDQRSGGQVNGVLNETYREAKNLNLPTNYVDALPDLEAALTFAKSNYAPSKIIIWGSSYSSSLVFILAQKHPEDIQGILSFSPGEYFEYEYQKIFEYASQVKCPVFITSAKNEVQSWKEIYNNISIVEKITFTPTSNGYHGSKALWEDHPGNEDYWNALMEFLTIHIL
jgi:pimeloyl-ACP methyl ester carboxylesterase